MPKVNVCTCGDASLSPLSPSEECCEDRNPDWLLGLTAWNDAGDDLAAQLQADCPDVEWNIVEGAPDCDFDTYPWWPVWGDDCMDPPESDKRIGSPGDVYSLAVDYAHSYIELNSGTDIVRSYTYGSGSVGAGPARFMTAVLWPDDGELDGTNYSSWVFWLNGPVDMNLSSGAFTVDDADDPDLFGQGYIGTDLYKAEIDMQADATGAMNSSNQTWYLDSYQTGAWGSVTLHLQGTYTETP